MKIMNKLFLGIFAFLLIALPIVSASTVVSNVFYEDSNSKIKQIDFGESTFIEMYADSIAENIVSVKLELVPSSGNSIVIFSKSVSLRHYQNTGFEITQGLYSEAGEYTLKFTATTNSGSFDIDELTLIVNPSEPEEDTTAPVITIIGSNPYVINQYETYTDQGATAMDNVDGSVSVYVVSNNVNTNTAGTYSVVYSASDSSGNTATKTRSVIVQQVSIDTEAPVIIILGDNPETIAVGSTYIDAGATAMDNVDGDLTSQIIVTNNVDTNTAGTYSVIYSVSDAAGNPATETRTVEVVADTTAPIITVIRPQEGEDYDVDGIVFEVELNEAGSVEYSLDGAARVAMTETGTFVFTSDELELDEDDYQVTFYAEDLAGNTAEVTINFEIKEDNDDKKSSSSYDGSSYEFKLYEEQSNPRKPVIDLSDEAPVLKKLNWIQRFINWIVQLFGGKAVY